MNDINGYNVIFIKKLSTPTLSAIEFRFNNILKSEEPGINERHTILIVALK
ncbi:hypothetical protein ES705_50966 [subsurface metagenome]